MINTIGEFMLVESSTEIGTQLSLTLQALSHAYTAAEEDTELQFQQLSLNLQPVHKDPRHKALVKIENCKLLVRNSLCVNI